MTEQKMFTSTRIAQEAKRVFGDQVSPVNVKMKYRKEVDEFLKKIEKAHVRAEHSSLTFK